jgi:hypothetical protein
MCWHITTTTQVGIVRSARSILPCNHMYLVVPEFNHVECGKCDYLVLRRIVNMQRMLRQVLRCIHLHVISSTSLTYQVLARYHPDRNSHLVILQERVQAEQKFLLLHSAYTNLRTLVTHTPRESCGSPSSRADRGAHT